MTLSLPLVRWTVAGRAFNGYQICGALGILAGMTTAAMLTRALQLSGPVMAASTVAGLIVLILVTVASNVLLGREVLVNYHHLVCVTAAAAAVMRASGVTLLPHLAAFVVALMMFQAVARIGCLLVGCCHGRPLDWGVRYGPRHAAEGFAPHLVDVPLAPVQAIDAAWALTIGVIASAALVTGRTPAGVLAGTVAAYAGGRFVTAFWRGSDARRLGGYSEAQWASLALLAALAAAAPSTGVNAGTVVVSVAVLALALAWQLVRRLTPMAERRLLDADHVLELAGALSIICDRDGAPDVHVATTSEGITLSRGTVWYGDQCAHHYTMSLVTGVMTARCAGRLARLVARLRHRGLRGSLQRGHLPGTFHLMMPCVVRPPDEVKPSALADQRACSNARDAHAGSCDRSDAAAWPRRRTRSLSRML